MLAVAIVLAGCETGPTRADMLSTLVGKPESEALRLMGAPNHVLDANGHRFLAYEDQGVGYAGAPYGPFGPYGYGLYYPAAFPIVRSCVTTLDIVAGRVASWTLRGNAC